QETVLWGGISPPDIDTTEVLRAQAVAPSANHIAPLAPRKGLPGGPRSASNEHQSPISGTYALSTTRRQITQIACESCRKRKSKCNGARPKCNTCQAKNLSCVYDVAESEKTTTQLRTHVRRLENELNDMKSIVSLLTLASDRNSAATWAIEVETNGFAHHSVEEIKEALQSARKAS
ncbi:C6 transcription factor, partial [Paraphaeosphaeria sporulosa]